MAILSNAHFPYHLSSLVLVSVLLSACGGGSSGPITDDAVSPTDTSTPDQTTSATSTAPSNTSTQDNGLTTIEYHGDSTIWGYRSGSGDRVATPAPTAFAANLPTSSQYVVRNKGVSSADACELLNGGNSRYAQSWETYMAASDANIVIINHAINDQWRMTVERYKSCLNSLASIAKQHGKRVIFETPNPTRDSYPGGLEVYAEAMRSVALAHGAPLIDQYAYLMKNYLNDDYRNVPTIAPDGLHPDEATYILKGRYAAQVFSQLAG